MSNPDRELPTDNPEGGAAPASHPATASTGGNLDKLAKLWRYGCPLLCLFQFSLLVSWLLLGGTADRVATAEDPDSVKATPTPENPPKPPGMTAPSSDDPPDPRVGKTLLKAGNFAAALEHFLPSEPEAKTGNPDSLAFCTALCLEGLGRWKEALAAYRVAATTTKSPQVAAAGLVAQARIWVRKNQTAEAKALLYPLILQAGKPEQYQTALLAEARYLLGLALAQETIADQRLVALDETLAPANVANWPITHSLDWITLASEVKEPGRKLPTPVGVLAQYGPKSEELLLRGSEAETAVAILVERLANLGKLHVHWSLAAWQRIKDRNAQVAFDGVPLLEAMQALVEPHGLVCHVNGLVLQAATQEETPKDKLTEWRNGAARQALRAAVFADPSHPLAATAYLQLGNDDAASGKPDEAVAWYEKLISDSPRSGNVTTAFFNLGLVQRVRKDNPAARKAFYHVVDRDPGHEIAPRALVQVGLTFLAEGQPLEAMFPLRQALAMAPTSPNRGEALVAFSAACLLTGNPQETNTILAANRQHVNHDPWRTSAAFLDGLARLRIAGTSKTLRTEAADLLAALLAFQNRPALGPIGRLLAGQAYQELGLSQQMAKVYEEAQIAAQGPVAEEMRYGLAEYHWNQNKREPALKLLKELASLQKGKWPCAARFRLARIALEDGNAQECLTVCNDLLTEGAGVDRSAALHLMGEAFEHSGDYQKAARCYAGKMPD